MEEDSRKYADFIKEHPVVYFDGNIFNGMSGSEFKICVFLRMFGNGCCTSITYKNFSIVTGLSESTIYRCLKKLEKRGLLIHARKQLSASNCSATCYRLIYTDSNSSFFSIETKYLNVLSGNGLLLYAFLIYSLKPAKEGYISLYYLTDSLGIRRETIKKGISELEEMNIIKCRPQFLYQESIMAYYVKFSTGP